MEKSYVIVYKGDIEKALTSNGIQNYVILNTKIGVIYVDEAFDEKIFMNIPEISWWDIEVPMSDTIEVSNATKSQSVDDAIDLEYIYNNPYITSTGKGVIIAVIGSGIDYLHPDFTFEDGSTKIVSIWDQEQDTKPPPKGMLFGSEFTREDINKAITNTDTDLSEDFRGKGTIAAGLALGTGKLNVNYKGVAPGSELLVVKLREYNGVYKEGRISYKNTDFLCAIRYVLDVALRENKMLIIDLKIAGQSRVGIITNYIDTFPEINNEGIVVVSAAGNERNTDIHYQGNFEGNLEPKDVTIQVGEQNSLRITLTVNGPGRVAAAIISPSGEMSRIAYYSPDSYLYSGQFNLESASYEMRFIYPWISTGKEELVINIYDIKPGVWTVRLIPTESASGIYSGIYDLYLPNKNLISEETRFLNPNPNSTITMYGTTEPTITIGAFNGLTNGLWIGSSIGPTRTKTLKPDIIAPGVNIMSTSKNQSYTSSTGTGVSSSIVCGVLALFMEYLSQEGNLTRKALSTQVLKTYLMLGAKRQEIYQYPNPLQGYGILDLRNTINVIANNL